MAAAAVFTRASSAAAVGLSTFGDSLINKVNVCPDRRVRVGNYCTSTCVMLCCVVE